MKSNCCGANVKVSTSDEGTSCYVCLECNRACDFAVLREQGCQYNDCGKQVFATESVTEYRMKLCIDHFKMIFGRVAQNAQIVEDTDKKKMN